MHTYIVSYMYKQWWLNPMFMQHARTYVQEGKFGPGMEEEEEMALVEEQHTPNPIPFPSLDNLT